MNMFWDFPSLRDAKPPARPDFIAQMQELQRTLPRLGSEVGGRVIRGYDFSADHWGVVHATYRWETAEEVRADRLALRAARAKDSTRRWAAYPLRRK